MKTYSSFREEVLETNRDCNPFGRVDYPLIPRGGKYGLTPRQSESVLRQMQRDGLVRVSFDHGYGVVYLTPQGR